VGAGEFDIVGKFQGHVRGDAANSATVREQFVTISISGSDGRKYITVRELGGEIWAEFSSLAEGELPWKTKNKIVDIVMGVIARHVGMTVGNDEGLPVSPLPISGGT